MLVILARPILVTSMLVVPLIVGLPALKDHLEMASVGVTTRFKVTKAHMVDALTCNAEEGRTRRRYASGRRQRAVDPEISEWGNPSSIGRNSTLNI